MKRGRLVLLCVVLLGVGAGLFLRARNDPGAREIRRVQKRLAQLATDISFTDREPPIQRLAYPGRVVDFFTDPARIPLSLERDAEHQALSRSQLRDLATGIRVRVRGLDVRFMDIVVELGHDPLLATAHLTSKIYVPGDADYWVQEFRLTLAKEDQEWRVQHIETLRTMER